MDSKTEVLADKEFKKFLEPYKTQLDKEMNEIIGIAPVNMPVHAPESLLSNFTADAFRQVASAYLKSPVDIAIVNLKGLRTQIPAGEITVSKVFELMPFENELVLLWLKGSDLNDLLQFFASIGGEGVSGLKMGIKNGKAVDVRVGGKPVDPAKDYIIATNDYLAEGNDGMSQLAKNDKRIDTGMKIREMLIDYIKNETSKGHKIESKRDGRIIQY